MAWLSQLAAWFLAAATPAGAGLAFPPLPVSVAGGAVRPLAQCADPELQRILEKGVRADPARALLERQGKLAVGLVDLRDPAIPRYAALQGDLMMYAASLPKIAILLAAYVALDEGSLRDGPQVQNDMAAMIRVSNNQAATAVIDRLGFEKIAAVLTDPRLAFYDPGRGGGLWVGKRYASQGRRFPEPLQGLSHAATAYQVCRFYYLLATGRLLSPKRSAQMLQHLSRPELHHGFVGAIEKRAPGVQLYRKSGTWRTWHSDSVLVWGPGFRRYILVGLIDDPAGGAMLRALVPIAEAALLARQAAPGTGD